MAPRKRRSFSQHQIAKYWIDWEIEHKTIPPWSSHGWDYGEPACMAGGRFKPEWDNKPTASGRWNSTGLEKCHIIPLAKGGPDEISNMVLMCENCHAMHPDSTDPEVTYAYMRERTLWDCHGISGVVMQGIIAVSAGEDLNTVTERTIQKARAVNGK